MPHTNLGVAFQSLFVSYVRITGGYPLFIYKAFKPRKNTPALVWGHAPLQRELSGIGCFCAFSVANPVEKAGFVDRGG